MNHNLNIYPSKRRVGSYAEETKNKTKRFVIMTLKKRLNKLFKQPL